jgi:hypothetical protein
MAYNNNINDLFLKNINTKFGFIKFCQFYKMPPLELTYEYMLTLIRNVFQCGVYTSLYNTIIMVLHEITVTQCANRAQKMLIIGSANFASTTFCQQ